MTADRMTVLTDFVSIVSDVHVERRMLPMFPWCCTAAVAMDTSILCNLGEICCKELEGGIYLIIVISDVIALCS